MSNIGELEPLQREIVRLKAKIKTRDERLLRMETPNKKFENMKHNIRVICKDQVLLSSDLKLNKIFELTLE